VVVRELGPVEDEVHEDHRAVFEGGDAVQHLLGHGRSDEPAEDRDRDGAEHAVRFQVARAIGSLEVDTCDAPVRHVDRGRRAGREDLHADLFEFALVSSRDFPDAAASGIDELGDVGAGNVLRPEEGLLDRVPQAEQRDPLGCPVSADLVARDPPGLLGVGAEEDIVELAAEAVDDPVLEVVVGPAVKQGSELHPHVVGEGLHQDELGQAADDIAALQGIVEEAVVQEEAGEAVGQADIVAEESPHLADQLLLVGVETVGPVVVVELTPLGVEGEAGGESPDVGSGLDHGGVPAASADSTGGRQAGQAGAQHNQLAGRIAVGCRFGLGGGVAGLAPVLGTPTTGFAVEADSAFDTIGAAHRTLHEEVSREKGCG